MLHFRRASCMNIKLPYFNKKWKIFFRKSDRQTCIMSFYISCIYSQFIWISLRSVELFLSYQCSLLSISYVPHESDSAMPMQKKKAYKISFKPQSLVLDRTRGNTRIISSNWIEKRNFRISSALNFLIYFISTASAVIILTIGNKLVVFVNLVINVHSIGIAPEPA